VKIAELLNLVEKCLKKDLMEGFTWFAKNANKRKKVKKIELKSTRATYYKLISNCFVLSVSFLTNCESTNILFCLAGKYKDFEFQKRMITLNELKDFFIYIKNNPQIYKVKNMPKTYETFKQDFCYEDATGEVILINGVCFLLGISKTQEIVGIVHDDILIHFLFGDVVYNQYKKILKDERDERLLKTMEPVGSA
jgi:hypothetical protein